MASRHSADRQPQFAAAARVKATIAAFNTWAYKREQPSDLALTTAVVARAIEMQQPIPFILYWGKGPRTALASPEERSLDYIAGMSRRISEVYAPGASFLFLLTDTHAHFNNHTAGDTDSYFAAVAAAVRTRGFESRRLSNIVLASAPHLAPGADDTPSPEVLQQLAGSAAKWYRGSEPTEVAAASYYAMNMLEKRAIDWSFPGAIFITFNSSRLRVLFPDTLPIFYMHSLKKGISVKPWFMPATVEREQVLAPHSAAPSSQQIIAAS